MVMMGGDQQHRQQSGRKPLRLGSFFGFLALLANFLLPLIYYAHLTGFSLPAASGDPRAGPPIILSHSEKPLRPQHDNSCPICRAASSFQHYGFFPLLFSPNGAALVGLLPCRDHTPGITHFARIVSSPRGPPIVFPAGPVGLGLG